MSGIRIGINALYLIPGGVGGTEIYLRSLLAALGEIDQESEYVIFVNRETGGHIAPPRANFRCVLQPVRARSRPARITWEQTGLPVAAAREEVEVLFNPGFTAPLLCRCPTVTVFHDLQHKRHPEHFRLADLLGWRVWLFQAACTSDALIAVSEATRGDMLRYYPVPPAKIRVIPHGVDERMFEIGRRRRELSPEAYLLYVSTLHPHKNLDRLLRVFSRFRRRRTQFRLVLAGMRGFYAEAVEQQVSELGLRDAVRIAGWVPREELYEIYARAHACVYPSTFEGFGMPVLEAMAAGIPTACSAIEPLKELAGEAAVQFDPEDERAMLDAMERVSCDETLRALLRQRGPECAARFSWRKSAAAALEVLHSVAQQAL